MKLLKYAFFKIKNKWLIRLILVFTLFNSKMPNFQILKKISRYQHFQRKYVSALKRYYEKCHVSNIFWFF